LGSWIRDNTRGRKSTQLALLVLVFFFVLAMAAELLVSPNGLDVNVSQALRPASSEYPLGTDYVGRDVLALLVYGTRSALLTIVATQVFAFPLGIGIGMISAYVGGKTDLMIMRLVDAILAFPSVILALALATALGAGIGTAIVAVVVAQIGPYARLSRVLTMNVKSQSYFDSAQVAGAGPARIVLFHIFPNIRSPLIVQSAFSSAAALLTVAALSFLGVGAQPPSVDWGLMMYESRNYISTHMQLEVLPGLMIAILILALNTIAEAMRDRLDPKTRTQAGAQVT